MQKLVIRLPYEQFDLEKFIVTLTKPCTPTKLDKTMPDKVRALSENCLQYSCSSWSIDILMFWKLSNCVQIVLWHCFAGDGEEFPPGCVESHDECYHSAGPGCLHTNLQPGQEKRGLTQRTQQATPPPWVLDELRWPPFEAERNARTSSSRFSHLDYESSISPHGDLGLNWNEHTTPITTYLTSTNWLQQLSVGTLAWALFANRISRMGNLESFYQPRKKLGPKNWADGDLCSGHSSPAVKSSFGILSLMQW